MEEPFGDKGDPVAGDYSDILTFEFVVAKRFMHKITKWYKGPFLIALQTW